MKKMNHGNYVKTTAGGGHKMFSNSPSAKSLNNSKRFFTPIVASSLAKARVLASILLFFRARG